jgi:hypothetical protein
MNRALPVLCSVALLTACVAVPTPTGFEQRLSQVQGRDINQVLTVWGMPAKVFSMPNGEYVYSFGRGPAFRSTASTTANADDSYDSSLESTSTYGRNGVRSYCRIHLVVNAQQRVSSYRYEGDRCRAPQ